MLIDMEIDETYLIFKKDFKHRNWIDWIKSHMMLAPPPYRFKGSVLFDYKGITFQGFNTYSKESTQFTIRKKDITQLYYGYDETFSTFQARGMGLTWAPIRITFESTTFFDEDDETELYMVSKFNGAFSDNQILFEELKLWLS